MVITELSHIIIMTLMSAVCTALPSVTLQMYIPASEATSELNIRVLTFPVTLTTPDAFIGRSQVIVGRSADPETVTEHIRL